MTSDERSNDDIHEPEIEIQFTHSEKASQKVSSSDVSDQVLVIIKKIAKDYIDEYAATDTSRELGGVLIGSYEETGGRHIVKISAAIKARYTDASLAEIKFTHQTWEDIDKVKELYYPNEKIIGWFHTHPGFGIFLSDYDLFIQNNFFKFPYQVAYVVDPIKGKSGFFGNTDGTIKRIKYQIEEPKASTVGTRSRVSAYSKKKKGLWASIFRLLTVAVLLFSFYVAYNYGIAPILELKSANTKLLQKNAELHDQVNDKEQEIEKLMAMLDDLQPHESASVEEVAGFPESEELNENSEQPLNPPGEEETGSSQNNGTEQ